MVQRVFSFCVSPALGGAALLPKAVYLRITESKLIRFLLKRFLTRLEVAAQLSSLRNKTFQNL